MTWGVVVQANEALLRGKWLKDLPATAAWGEPGVFDAFPGDLLWIASRLASLKHRAPLDPELARAADLVTNETSTVACAPLPPMVTGATPAGAGRIIVHTMRLPDAKLQSRILPLVVAPDRTPMAMIAPASCWPKRLHEDPLHIDRIAAAHVRPEASFPLPEPLAERRPTSRPKGSPPRVAISAAARDAVRAAVGGALDGALVVRVDPRTGVTLTFSRTLSEALRTFRVDDVSVAFDPDEADELDGLRIEWSDGPFGPGFSVWHAVV